MFCLALSLLLLTQVGTQPPPAPARDASAQTAKGSASIKGKVTAADSGRPVDACRSVCRHLSSRKRSR